MFNDRYFDELPNDPILAGQKVCRDILRFRGEASSRGEALVQYYDEYLMALGLFQALMEACGIEFNFPYVGENKHDNIGRIHKFFEEADTEIAKGVAKLSIDHFKTRFATKFSRIFLYEFSEGDLNRIQELINELRQLISDSKLFSENHKARLLKRLERLQSELHKKVTDLDRFWGLIGEAGIAIGKFGNDVKPIVDRIREIADIVWRTQARAEELPSGLPIPMLKEPDEVQ